jgi:hypothetical protein
MIKALVMRPVEVDQKVCSYLEMSESSEVNNIKRLTKLSSSGAYYVLDSSMVFCVNDEYRGEAVEKLAKFENLHQYLMEMQKIIPAEMDKLREQNKTKSYRFKELMAQKLMHENMLNLFILYGLG